MLVKNAPIIGQSINEEVAMFINKYFSCALPNKDDFPTLYERVNEYQTHRHNSNCMRLKATAKGHVRKCRFGFPRNESEAIIIRTVESSIYGRRNLKPNSRLYDLPHKNNERFINDYNAFVILAWEGNMDLQVICEKSAVLSYYITKYQTKPEKSINVDVFHNINSNKSLQ